MCCSPSRACPLATQPDSSDSDITVTQRRPTSLSTGEQASLGQILLFCLHSQAPCFISSSPTGSRISVLEQQVRAQPAGPPDHGGLQLPPWTRSPDNCLHLKPSASSLGEKLLQSCKVRRLSPWRSVASLARFLVPSGSWTHPSVLPGLRAPQDPPHLTRCLH